MAGSSLCRPPLFPWAPSALCGLHYVIYLMPCLISLYNALFLHHDTCIVLSDYINQEVHKGWGLITFATYIACIQLILQSIVNRQSEGAEQTGFTTGAVKLRKNV